MRYLLLSVLVVSLVGVLIIPIAYATHTDEHWRSQVLEKACNKVPADDSCPFPEGVIFPAYQFENALLSNKTLSEVYKEMGYPKKGYSSDWGNIYRGYSTADQIVVNGDGKDLLVFNFLIDNKRDVSNTMRLSQVIMYDNKDRKFIPSTSYMVEFGNKVENIAFSWRENCPDYQLFTIQPGTVQKIKVCYEIPKNSDHFKVVSTGNLALTFDREYTTIYSTILSLFVIHHQQSEMYFSGKLKTTDGSVVKYATINIQESKLGVIATLKTDKNGRFGGPWEVSKEFAGANFDFIAVYDGGSNTKNTQSETKSVTVRSLTPPPAPPSPTHPNTMPSTGFVFHSQDLSDQFTTTLHVANLSVV